MAPDFTLADLSTATTTDTTTSTDDDAPHSGQAGGGGVEPDVRYLTAGIEPGKAIDRPWHFNDKPLLMLFDKAGPYAPGKDEGGSGTAAQGRNAVANIGLLGVTDPEDAPERANFPEDRSFNAVCLTLGSSTVSLTAPPRPGLGKDRGPGADPDADGLAVSLTTDYATNKMQGDTLLFVPLPERELLQVMLTGQKQTGNFDWPKQARNTWGDVDAIFKPIDDFFFRAGVDPAPDSGILTSAAVRQRLAGIFIADEPDLMRRMPEGFPEVVGIIAGRIEVGQDVAFRVVATEQPFDWEWEFFLNGERVEPTWGASNEFFRFQPILNFAEAGDLVVRVNVRNWHAKTGWNEFHVKVLSPGDPVIPQVTGLYTKTTDGIIRGKALTFNSSGSIGWTPGGNRWPGPGPIFTDASFRKTLDPTDPENGIFFLGQNGSYGVCAVNFTSTVISDFAAVSLNEMFPIARWEISAPTPTIAGNAVRRIEEEDQEILAHFPPHLLDSNTIQTYNVTFTMPQFAHIGTIRVALSVTQNRLDAPRSWLRPELLQVVADRVHLNLQNAPGVMQHPVVVFINFNGAIIEERFNPESKRPPTPPNETTPARPEDFLKLRFMADVDLTTTRANEGSRNQPDFDDPTFPVVTAANSATTPPPAAIFRLNRVTTGPSQVYSIDHYPITGSDAQLLAKAPAAFGLDPANVDEVRTKIRAEVDVRDPIRALHAYSRFLHDVSVAKGGNSGEGDIPTAGKKLLALFWNQMWGFPHRRDGHNTLTSAGVITHMSLARDPESPAPNDGWDLEKASVEIARLQAFMPLFLGAEGAAWFSQHFCADDLIFLLYNPIAAEILSYADLRSTGLVMSKRGAAGRVNAGPLNNQPFMGWEDLTPQPDNVSSGRDAQGNIREMINIDGNRLPLGRIEMGVVCAVVQRFPTAIPAPTVPEQFLFLANPSFRMRTLSLDFNLTGESAIIGDRWLLHRFGERVLSLSGLMPLLPPLPELAPGFPATPLVIGNHGIVNVQLGPGELRIYHREVQL